jgi:hypothetical protein
MWFDSLAFAVLPPLTFRSYWVLQSMGMVRKTPSSWWLAELSLPRALLCGTICDHRVGMRLPGRLGPLCCRGFR